MSVKIYLDIQMNLQLLDTIPENATDNISFYVFNYGMNPLYQNERLFYVSLKKVNGTIKCTNAYGGYIEINAVLEQDSDGVYLYKSNSGKPANPLIFAGASNISGGALLVCDRCTLQYIDSTSCKCIMHLTKPNVQINIKHHTNPSTVSASIPTSSLWPIYIYNSSNYLIFSYTPSKENDEFVDVTKTISPTDGCPLVIERNDDDVYIHSSNKLKPTSSNCIISTNSTMKRYLSIERVKFTYVSDHEVDLDIYITPSHGRIMRYYALYTYTAMEPDYPDKENND